MKRFISAALVCLMAAHAMTGAGKKTVTWTTVKADDAAVRYIGRVLVSDGMVSYDWNGTTMKVRFEGNSLKLDCKSTGTSMFNLWVDKQPSHIADDVITVKDCDTTLVLASVAGKGVHEVILQKRSEGEQGEICIKSVSTDGKFVAPLPAKERVIEFVGDSYTCGYGTENSVKTDPFKVETENCNLAYAQIISRYFDAECVTVSHSGMGISRNYAGKTMKTMPQRYGQIFDERHDDAYDFKAYTPDVVVIYLGTNDFSTSLQPSLEQFVKDYIGLISDIKKAYGEDIPVLCVSSKASDVLGDYVRRVADVVPFKNVHYTTIQNAIMNDDSELGASWHPNYQGQRKVAMAMIPYISTITGWELPEKVIE